MMKPTVLLLGVLLFALSHSQPAYAGESAPASKQAAATPAKATPKTKTLTAKFVDFSLGDASHYIFEDKTGKTWDFDDNRATNIALSQELPEKEANETNQGWAPNKKMVGKWFNISYEIRTGPLYQDGPIGKIKVIVGLTLIEKPR